MKPWKAVLALLGMLSLAWIAAAGNVDQTAEVEGGNVVKIVIVQEAQNGGEGDISQSIVVIASNNSQELYQVNQDAYSGSEGNVDDNASLTGLNLILLELSQSAENAAGSGNIYQEIVVIVEDNEQILMQEVDLLYIEV